jgi:hypothetical protein
MILRDVYKDVNLMLNVISCYNSDSRDILKVMWCYNITMWCMRYNTVYRALYTKYEGYDIYEEHMMYEGYLKGYIVSWYSIWRYHMVSGIADNGEILYGFIRRCAASEHPGAAR